MNFVIPMAGKGKRFSEAGHKDPKPLIEVKGKTLMQWSVDSLPLDKCSKMVFIILKDHEEAYGISDKIKFLYGEVCKLEFVFLGSSTRGQSETVFAAKDKVDFGKPLLIFNIDTYFRSSSLPNSLESSFDGVLGAFKADSSDFSFAKTDSRGFVLEVAEKDPLSDNALTGLYHFSSAKDFFRVAAEQIRNNETVKGEFYIAPLYNKLIKEGKKFVLDFCDEHHVLGTPKDIRNFKNE